MGLTGRITLYADTGDAPGSSQPGVPVDKSALVGQRLYLVGLRSRQRLDEKIQEQLQLERRMRQFCAQKASQGVMPRLYLPRVPSPSPRKDEPGGVSPGPGREHRRSYLPPPLASSPFRELLPFSLSSQGRAGVRDAAEQQPSTQLAPDPGQHFDQDEFAAVISGLRPSSAPPRARPGFIGASVGASQASKAAILTSHPHLHISDHLDWDEFIRRQQTFSQAKLLKAKEEEQRLRTPPQQPTMSPGSRRIIRRGEAAGGGGVSPAGKAQKQQRPDAAAALQAGSPAVAARGSPGTGTGRPGDYPRSGKPMVSAPR